MVDLAKQLLRCVLICVLLYCSRTHHPSTTVLNANKPSTTGYMVAAKCWSRIPAKCCTSACSKSASKSSKSPPTLLPAPSLFLQTKRRWTTTNKAKKNRTNNNSVSTKMVSLPSQIHQAHSQLLQDKYPRAAVSQFFLTGPLSWLAHQSLNSMT